MGISIGTLLAQSQPPQKSLVEQRLSGERAEAQPNDPDKAENDELRNKMQFAETKLEVLGESLGAMQKAVRESGNDGILMYRRVSKLGATTEEFKETDAYKNKKENDTTIKDQIDALRESEKELREKRAKKQEEKKAEEKRAEEKKKTEEAAEEQPEIAVESTQETDDKKQQSEPVVDVRI